MADLLIGGAGFIGAYVARQLLDAGEDVAVYDRDVRHGPIVDLLRPDELARLTLLPGDVTDAVHLTRTIAELRPRRIVHLAAMLTPAGQADPATAVRVITLGTTHILEAMRMLGVERLVWTSSAQVFGPLDRYRRRHGLERIADDATPDPISVYGACKAQVERLAAHYAATWGLDITGLRPCGTLGRGRLRSDLSVIVDPLRRVARGEPAIVKEADWVFPLIHIDDVVDAVLAVLRRPDRGDGRGYNLAAHHTTLREVAGVLCELVPGARIEIEGCATEPSARIEASGIERDLGIRSRRGLKEGVGDMLEEARGAPG